MNQQDRLERDLSAWLDAAATPRTPDWTADLIAQTGRIRQRPRWTFPEHWLPGRARAFVRPAAVPFPWRAIGVIALLGLLVASLLIVAGSRPRLPEPFGLARNGLVAYARAGNILTVDPVTGERRAIVVNSEVDAFPRWSLDGTRIVFLREAMAGHLIVTAMADGSRQVVANTGRLVNVDPESLAWSHDGRSIAVMADDRGKRAIFIVDAVDQGVRKVPSFGHLGPDMHWRPPDGRQLTFRDRDTDGFGLFLYSLDTGDVERLTPPSQIIADLRPGGWTPDGLRYAYHEGLGQGLTWVAGVASPGLRTELPVANGQLSNDGTRVAGVDGDLNSMWLCVIPASGGDCLRIGPQYPDDWGTNHRWSPDDQWILSTRANDFMPFAFDPDVLTDGKPAWVVQGGDSWQRLAP